MAVCNREVGVKPREAELGVILSERVTGGSSVLSLGNLDGTAPQPSRDRSPELSLLS